MLQRHGCVMTLVNQRLPSLDTIVLDVIGTDMVVGLHCLSLTSWNARLHCVAQRNWNSCFCIQHKQC